MRNVRSLKVVQACFLLAWLLSMILFAIIDGPARWIWLTIWTLTMAGFFAATWRAMWLNSDRKRSSQGAAEK